MMLAGINPAFFNGEAIMPRVFGRTVRRRTLVIGGVVLGIAALSFPYAQKTFTLARAGTLQRQNALLRRFNGRNECRTAQTRGAFTSPGID